MEHLQNLDTLLAEVERAGDHISGEKLDRFWYGVNSLEFVCGEVGVWPQVSNVEKVSNSPSSETNKKSSGSLVLCT